MSTEQNKALARRWPEEIFSKGDLSVIDEIVSPDYFDNTSTPTVEGLKQGVRSLHETFSNIRITVEEQIAEGDTVVNRLHAEATYRGGMPGVPDTAIGKQVVMAGIDIFRFANGKFVERFNVADLLSWFEQLDMSLSPKQSDR